MKGNPFSVRQNIMPARPAKHNTFSARQDIVNAYRLEYCNACNAIKRQSIKPRQSIIKFNENADKDLDAHKA